LLAALGLAIAEQAGFDVRRSKARQHHDQRGQQNHYTLHNKSLLLGKTWGTARETPPTARHDNSLCHRQNCFVPNATTVGSGGENEIFCLANNYESNSPDLATLNCSSFLVALKPF
jgi:hypothetical protein